MHVIRTYAEARFEALVLKQATVILMPDRFDTYPVAWMNVDEFEGMVTCPTYKTEDIARSWADAGTAKTLEVAVPLYRKRSSK